MELNIFFFFLLRFMWFGIILLILLLVGSLAFALLHVNVYGLDYSLTGWVFMGLSIGFVSSRH